MVFYELAVPARRRTGCAGSVASGVATMERVWYRPPRFAIRSRGLQGQPCAQGRDMGQVPMADLSRGRD